MILACYQPVYYLDLNSASNESLTYHHYASVTFHKSFVIIKIYDSRDTVVGIISGRK